MNLTSMVGSKERSGSRPQQVCTDQGHLRGLLNTKQQHCRGVELGDGSKHGPEGGIRWQDGSREK